MAKTNDFSSNSTFNPTPHKLVIAEKPSVARSIANVLGASNKKKGCLEGNGYIVSWCVGHLIALAEPEAYDVKYTVKPWQLDTLPILPQKWKFKVIEETKEQYGILKSLMQNETVNEIICATDAGREGECIFRYVYKLAGCNKPVKRLWISSVEESDIRQGFDNLKDDREYDNLYSSGFARAKADWLVGMNATRLFSAASGAFLSVGRVQTPTLAMIVNRENEINSFQKQKYYTVELNCGAFSVCSEKITELSSAQRIQNNTDENTAFIKSIVTENKKVKPPELFDLTALQKTANISLGYTAQMAGFVCGLIQKYSNADISISRKVFGKCPKCGGNVVEYSKMYGCEKRKSCGFKIWKTISGKSLPEGAVLSLLDLGHTAKLKGFKKKDGKGKFDAILVMNDDFTLSFKFK